MTSLFLFALSIRRARRLRRRADAGAGVVQLMSELITTDEREALRAHFCNFTSGPGRNVLRLLATVDGQRAEVARLRERVAELETAVALMKETR